METHTKKKSKLIHLGNFDEKELYVEVCENAYFWWFGKLCTVTNKPEIAGYSLRWLLRNDYSEEVWKEVNKKMKEVQK